MLHITSAEMCFTAYENVNCHCMLRMNLHKIHTMNMEEIWIFINEKLFILL